MASAAAFESYKTSPEILVGQERDGLGLFVEYEGSTWILYRRTGKDADVQDKEELAPMFLLMIVFTMRRQTRTARFAERRKTRTEHGSLSILNRMTLVDPPTIVRS